VKAILLEMLTGRGPLVPLLTLAFAGALVFMIAARLARHADAIAHATRLGGLWIGSVLLAAATSLPEILTDANAVLLDAPDIGVGDLFGSTLANLLILAALDLGFAGRRILHSVSAEHARLGTLGILLTVMAGLAIVTERKATRPRRVGRISISTSASPPAGIGGTGRRGIAAPWFRATSHIQRG